MSKLTIHSHDLSNKLPVSGDIDELAAALDDVMRSLVEGGESESEKVLTVSQLIGTDPSLLTGKKGISNDSPDLMAVYKNLIDMWVTCLPRRTPGSLRLAKERLIRGVTADLALNSVALSMRAPPQTQKPDTMSELGTMDLDRMTLFSSQPNSVSGSPPKRARSRSSKRELSHRNASSGPSSISGSSSATEGQEDPAISILRKYADFRPQPPSGATQARILSHWVPGSDPDQYSWEATKRATAAAEDGDEDDALSQRERRRRKKRASRAGTTESASQPPPSVYSQTSLAPSQPNFGSQPAFAPPIASSQVTGDMPMTQVEEGRYGGRQVLKKKAKKRKQGF